MDKPGKAVPAEVKRLMNDPEIAKEIRGLLKVISDKSEIADKLYTKYRSRIRNWEYLKETVLLLSQKSNVPVRRGGRRYGISPEAKGVVEEAVRKIFRMKNPSIDFAELRGSIKERLGADISIDVLRDHARKAMIVLGREATIHDVSPKKPKDTIEAMVRQMRARAIEGKHGPPAGTVRLLKRRKPYHPM